MTAFIKGNVVEGSLEEIAKLLGITLEDSSYSITDTNTYHIPAQSCPPDYNPGFCYPECDCDGCWKQWKKEVTK